MTINGNTFNTHEELEMYTHGYLMPYTHEEIRGRPYFKKWTAGDYYNHRELNRIEEILQQLYQLANNYWPNVGHPEFVKDRTIKSIELASSLNRLEGAIEHLGVVTHKPTGWVPTKLNWKPLDRFSYVDANRYEIDVELLHRLIVGNSENIHYCGQVYVGEELI